MRSWITKLWGWRAPSFPLSMEANNTVKGVNPRSSGPGILIQDVWKYDFLIHCVLLGEVLLIPVVFNGSLVYKNFVVVSGSLGKFYDLHYFWDRWDCLLLQDTSYLPWLCWSHIYMVLFCAVHLHSEIIFEHTQLLSRRELCHYILFPQECSIWATGKHSEQSSLPFWCPALKRKTKSRLTQLMLKLQL